MLQLLNQCLKYFNDGVHTYLQLNNYSAGNYAKFDLITFSACGQPAEQVIKLWDLFLLHGLYLNVLATVSRMLLTKDAIMGGTE